MSSDDQDKDKQPGLDLSALFAGLSLVEAKEEPDSRDVLEVSNLEDDKLKEEIEDLRSDRRLREKYADRILRFLEFYAAIIGVFIILNGFDWFAFNVPEGALIALVGSTAAAAIGLVGFVAKGLFGNNRHRK